MEENHVVERIIRLWPHMGSLRILMKRTGLGGGTTRLILGKFWHKIPDLDSLGTRSLDGNDRRKRTFVALYGRIGYQMHRASRPVEKQKESVRVYGSLATLSHRDSFWRDATARNNTVSDFRKRLKLIQFRWLRCFLILLIRKKIWKICMFFFIFYYIFCILYFILWMLIKMWNARIYLSNSEK